MSMTPIHIIAALPFAKHFDMKGFIAVNVLIDLFVVFALLDNTLGDTFMGQPSRLHDIEHSFLGAMVLAGVVMLFTWKWKGATVGAISHVVIDMFFHSDVMPFFPLTEANVFAGLLQPSWIDYFLIALPVIFWKRTKLALESFLPKRLNKQLW